MKSLDNTLKILWSCLLSLVCLLFSLLTRTDFNLVLHLDPKSNSLFPFVYSKLQSLWVAKQLFNFFLILINQYLSIITTFIIHKLVAVVRMSSVKKVFLEVSQNSQENACARVSFLVMLQTSGPNLEFCKFLKTVLYRAPLVAASDKSKINQSN